jgi:hypothetical protein
MALETSIQNYKLAEKLYFEINETYNKFQVGEINKTEQDLLIDQTILKIDKMKKLLDKIDVNEFDDRYDEKTIEGVTYNIQFFYEAANEIEKSLTSAKQYDDLYSAVRIYLSRMHLPEYEYRPWAKDEDELMKKFTSMLLHKDNIETFKNHIKRIILGTMSDNEFKKIFETNKKKMFKDYKGYNKASGHFFESFDMYKSRLKDE